MTDIVGVILAGGLAQRMGGGDKCLQSLNGKPLLDYAIARARPQVKQLLLNANGDTSRFDDYAQAARLPKANDVVEGFAGPLAGILTGMCWARENHPRATWLLSIASDTTFFPRDLAARLLARAEEKNAQIVVAESNDQIHPVFGLWHLSLAEDLRQALVNEEIRKIFRWIKRHRWTCVTFDNYPGNRSDNGLDPFFNINSPGDLAEIEKRIKKEDLD